MLTLDSSRVDKKVQGPLELVSYLFPFLSHSKPHTKTQIEMAQKTSPIR